MSGLGVGLQKSQENFAPLGDLKSGKKKKKEKINSYYWTRRMAFMSVTRDNIDTVETNMEGEIKAV